MIYFQLKRKIPYNNMKDRLTKTEYLRYLSCPNEFWLKANMPLLFKIEETLEYQHLRQQGYEVERYVKMLERFQPNDDIAVDFQRVFQTNELYARSDAVITDDAAGVIDIYEIKAAASVKPEHLADVAFQKVTAERAGFAVRKCHVITMNGAYVRSGEIDPEQLFTINDVTAEIAEMLEDTEKQIAAARVYADSEPVPSLVDYCMDNKLDCRYIKLHFPGLPDYTVFDIAFLKNDKRRELLSQGIVAITDVPDDFPLSAKQRTQVEAAKTNAIVIDREKIAERMDAWQYPLHFLDYETFAYAIPQFDGIKPFQQMCFQYSLHTLYEPGGELKHAKFLSHGDDDPPRALAASLKEAMAGHIGTVLVWYEGFEKARNTEMAAMFPEYADFFNEVNEKTYDLMKIFADKLYIHPEFKGRSSIKKVLPVLVPELKYTDLGIGDGMTATIKWFHAAKRDLPAEEREKIFADLEAYCYQDTYAMVRIVEVLEEL